MPEDGPDPQLPPGQVGQPGREDCPDLQVAVGGELRC